MYQVIASDIFGNFLGLRSCLGKAKLWGGHSSFLRLEFEIMIHFPDDCLRKITNLKKAHGDMLVHRQLPLLLDSRHHSWQHLAHNCHQHKSSVA